MTQNKNRDARDPWRVLRHALVDRCAERSCSLHVGRGEARIVKCDLLNKPVGFDRALPMCDYLMFSKSPSSFMAAVELKSGKFKTTKAISQLENGARHALSIAKKFLGLGSHTMFLVLVTNRHGNDLDQKRLHNIVRVNGFKCRIYSCPCGSKFANMLKNAPCSK